MKPQTLGLISAVETHRDLTAGVQSLGAESGGHWRVGPQRLRSRGCVVYLRTSVDQQLARTRRGTHRPLLDTPDPRGTLQRLMQQRATLYEAAADLAVDTDGRKVKTVVDEIVRRLEAARTE